MPACDPCFCSMTRRTNSADELVVGGHRCLAFPLIGRCHAPNGVAWRVIEPSNWTMALFHSVGFVANSVVPSCVLA